MKRAVIVAGPGFEDAEFVYPFYRLQEAGLSVDVATTTDAVVKGKIGIAATPTIKLEDLHADRYDILVVPGGLEGPDRLRQVPKILEFTRDMNAQKKVIASICHGPWVLISAGIVSGRKATCYVGCKDDLINAGAKYVNEPAVIDGNLVTSPHFRDNAAWMKATLQVLETK